MLAGMGTRALMGMRGLGSDPCLEDFWSAACWFGSGGAQALGVDNGAATMTIPTAPVPACAGTISVDSLGNRVCTQVAGVSDSNDTQSQLPTGGQYDAQAWNAWIQAIRDSANVPGNNTAGSGYVWLAVAGIGLVAVMAMKGK
jgi:hypothetical protein